ncbi:MAG: dienelactone hydrolase family protein [Polyangiaceae bacterium]|nr:dienelactone hydrolase family protein [Polyangiaceae bacterium]
MNGTKLDITTPDGVMDAYVTHPQGNGPWPAIIFFFDAFGLRNTMFAMADRLASFGYFVVAPNVYYRHGAFAPFDVRNLFSAGGPELERFRGMVDSIQDASVERDTGAVLDWLSREPMVRDKKIGATGYCMGGGLAVSAALSFPDRVVAAASFHGGRSVVDPKTPDLIAQKARAAFYLGVAEIDRRHTKEVSQNLEAAFTKAGVPHTIEIYPGASHGFAVVDHSVYDAPSAERHWERMKEFFGKSLA